MVGGTTGQAGAILGTADFPTQPWISSGGLELDTGTLTGLGRTSVGQGGSFDPDGLRLRFRARFTDSGQVVAMTFNGADDDESGVSITLDSSGTLRLSENDLLIGEKALAPLATDQDWFVEAAFTSTTAELTVARNNYGSDPGAQIAATLVATALHLNADGDKTVVDLQGAGALAPSVDELSVARCGLEPPGYENLFLDAFERADSSVLGSADFPSNATWTPSSADARIVDGALEVSGLAKASIPVATTPESGLRIRATLRAAGGNYWFDVNYNASSSGDDLPFKHPGFWLWGGGGATHTNVFLGNKASETTHAGIDLTAGTKYFVELNRDDGSVVLTVRTGSFNGPLLLVEANDGLTAAANTGQVLWLGTSGSAAVRFEDIQIDRYSLP